MSNVLFLVHRIPYPPNKGDKIRSYHLLRHLARRHSVFLGTFVDDPHDTQYVARVTQECAGSLVLPIAPRARRLASVSGLLTGEALSLPYYRSAALQRWVDETIERERIEAIVVFSSTMAQFVEGPKYRHLARIVDFVDVDSDKWRQYAARAAGPKAWLYAREANTLLAYERRIAREFDATLLVTGTEAELMRQLAPESSSKIGYYENGVDTAYFDPSLPFDNPYPAGGPVLVFTGAMDYWPNVEAVEWFADAVFPLVRVERPDVRFAIVGSNPSERVRALAARDGVIVTGRVPDVRPYLKHASVAVAPLRIARGVQNKLLEAMAMARPLVCTSPAAEGLRASPLIASLLAGSPVELARKVIAGLLLGEVRAHRDYVVAHYGWEANLSVVEQLLCGRIASGGAAGAVALESA